MFLEMSMKPYIQYLPPVEIDNNKCNSTENYNGKMDNKMICIEDIPCHVSYLVF